MDVQQVLIGGRWQPSRGTETFQATNPATKQELPERYPISPWEEVDQALDCAVNAFEQLRSISRESIARFLEVYAQRLEASSADIVEMANQETALPGKPRLADVELPRTTNQLRLAAKAARDGSWAHPTIDSASNIRSVYQAIGPVAVFGPNNFPLAFNGIAGGDFAAAIAAGNPVIAKANPSHPGTTRLLAEHAQASAEETGMPAGTVQMIYRTSHQDGARLVSDPRIGATGYTGSREAGLALKRAADEAGKPIYLELSSINPVIILPGALEERADALAEEFSTSCLMGAGQFCTNPGLVVLLKGSKTEQFISAVSNRFSDAPAGTLLGERVQRGLAESVEKLVEAGAELLTGGSPADPARYCFKNTLLRTTAENFLARPEDLQTESFGNVSLIVVADDIQQLCQVLHQLEGNLTGCIYSHTQSQDDDLYAIVEPILRRKVGRLLNDKMPTGVAVVPAMNHGGPYPATGHPGFTAVGIPASLLRFACLQCYDNVREYRLPAILKNTNLPHRPWRLVNGNWTREDI